MGTKSGQRKSWYEMKNGRTGKKIGKVNVEESIRLVVKAISVKLELSSVRSHEMTARQDFPSWHS